MTKRLPTWMANAALGVALGLALGIAVGWWLWPVMYTNTCPASLRQDYRVEYVLMIAASYETEQDIDAARDRLAALNGKDPATPLLELRTKLIAEGGSDEDIARLAQLAEALDSIDPMMKPYLESGQ